MHGTRLADRGNMSSAGSAIPMSSLPDRGTSSSAADAETRAWSMSESLAHGLFNQMSRRADEDGQRAYDRHPRPEPSGKRASAYRAARKWMNTVLLPEQFLGEVPLGDQSGKDKKACTFIIHWDTNPLCDVGREHLPADLVLHVTMIDARHVHIDHKQIATFTKHALMRLFYRLKTTSSALVLQEVGDMARLLFRWQRCPVGNAAFG